MTYHQFINEYLKKYDQLSKEEIFKIIKYLSKKNKNNIDIYKNINNKIDFKIKKAEKIIKKYLFKFIPLEYLTKTFYFCDIEYFINKKTFIPRQETENLVFSIIKEFNNEKDLLVLDLCSGSGCIANTLKYNFHNWEIDGVEKSIFPFITSLINKKKYKLKTNFILKNIFKWIKKNKKKYDLIICNPPYIPFDYKIDNKVKKEPKIALFASENGLKYYKYIIINLSFLIKENGILIFEIGFDQKEKIIEILKENNIKNFKFKKDQFNKYRNLYIYKDNNGNI